MARRMRCHYCDYSRLAPAKCEKCGSAFLHLYGVGTEKITETLRRLLPEANIERFDRDVTKKRGSIADILTRFAHRQIDILVGTQMLAKGHDFPNITLVGVVGADSAIGIPDFRASERLFQLITQVSGRSGRGLQPGIVIVQTFHPEHYAIQSSIEQNYRNFYDKEIRFRRLMQYPPYIFLANVVFSGKDSKIALEDAREFGKLLLVYKTEGMKLLGPAVAPLARLSGLFRFQMLLKSQSRKALHDCLRAVRDHFERTKHRSHFSMDVDPYSIA
jgi:primosomal protein N' (replication factor Y)